MKITKEDLMSLCEWKEEEVGLYKKGPATGGEGPIRYFVGLFAMARRLKNIGIEVEE